MTKKNEAVRMVIWVEDADRMRALGRELGKHVRAGDVIGLCGDLGAGKTTFTQGIAEGMGVFGAVVSPSFTLVHEHPGPLPLFHMDAYRLGCAEDLWDLGFEEYLAAEGVVVIEWCDRVLEALPDERLILVMEHAGVGRRILLRPQGHRACELAAVLWEKGKAQVTKR